MLRQTRPYTLPHLPPPPPLSPKPSRPSSHPKAEGWRPGDATRTSWATRGGCRWPALWVPPGGSPGGWGGGSCSLGTAPPARPRAGQWTLATPEGEAGAGRGISWRESIQGFIRYLSNITEAYQPMYFMIRRHVRPKVYSKQLPKNAFVNKCFVRLNFHLQRIDRWLCYI